MAGLSAKLEEQLTDLRSNQIAYKLTIENHDNAPVRLLAVEPRMPLGARLLEVTDTSLAEAHAKRSELRDDLNRLLRQYLWVSSADFRASWVEQQKLAVREIFSFGGILQIYFQMIFSPKLFQARMKREFESLNYHVDASLDARDAYTRWMANSTGNDAIRSLFLAKVEQLERVESLMDEGDKKGLTAIEPGSFFAATYVFQFERSFFDPRKYQINVDATYTDSDAPSAVAKNCSVSASVLISPYPLCLSAVAIVGALSGVFLQIALAGTPNIVAEFCNLAVSGRLLTAPIVALIFFNVYEHTSLGKDLQMPVSWRSALLIGALCGLGQDRILAALKALIGL